MRYYYRGGSYLGFGEGIHLTRTVKVLVIINVVVFILLHLFPRFPWLGLLGMVPKYVLSKFMLWQLFTYMFIHVGLWHLVVNMLMLIFFGPGIEEVLGRRLFLIYYFYTGIGAALCSFITAFNSPIPVVGASGAIFGLLVAYAILFPDTVLFLFFIFPMRIKQAVFFLAAINLLGALSSPNSGIAYFAHLGGGLFGYLYFKNAWIRIHLSHCSWRELVSRWKRIRRRKEEIRKRNLDEEVDRILDKVAQYGMESLTPRERKVLQYKSRKG
ncbi:MAG: hypothetical protein B6D56_08200 [Candidatus Omnitrophica bacterium 4484_70.1]|nr:MAG: hypothetical protein B6D56_08200 [Candidatus Omnitrophica bacterium 4484_70.1]